MEARLPAPFGHVRIATADHGRIAGIELSAEPAKRERPDGFPAKLLGPFEAYLAGEADRPEVPTEPGLGTSFQRAVWTALPGIPAGETLTYGELAHRIGRPSAARAVGNALARNPLPLVWPCHRVTARDGLGGFGGAPEGSGDEALAIKRWLLTHEDRG